MNLYPQAVTDLKRKAQRRLLSMSPDDSRLREAYRKRFVLGLPPPALLGTRIAEYQIEPPEAGNALRPVVVN